jgi:hypothetical protein
VIIARGKEVQLSPDARPKKWTTRMNVYLLVQVVYTDNARIVRKTSACRKFDPTEQRFTRIDNAEPGFAFWFHRFAIVDSRHTATFLAEQAKRLQGRG